MTASEKIKARKFKYVGTRPIRHDGVDKVTGRASFGADITVPGMLHGVVLRSPHAHARIKSINTKAAEAMPGVRAVVTGADLPETNAVFKMGGEMLINLRDIGDNCMAHGKALYHGHAVAAVAAMSADLARAAAERIEVEYEPLAPALDSEQALAAGAPILHDDMTTAGAAADKGPTNLAAYMEFKRGDLAQGFAGAEVVLDREFRTHAVHQGYIEPHACVARVGEDGQIVLWCTTQGGFMVRDMCAGILNLEPARLKVVPTEIGGGFGGKTTIYLEPVAIALARKARRPVKMVMSREEVFRATGPASATRIRLRLGAKRDGTLVAGEAALYYEAGAYRGSPAGAGAMCCFAAYRFPNFLIEAYDVVVNKPKVAAYRAPGAPMAAFAVESLMDELARELNMDPIELRLKNAVQEGDQAPYGPTYGPIGLRETLEAARKHPHYRAPLGPNQGRGVACGFWFNAGMNSSAIVSLHGDGSAAVTTGNPDIGGTRAAQAIMVAEELGIPVERVRPAVPDTDNVSHTDTTGGSRVCYATGMAVIEAARNVQAQLRARAAQIWGVKPEQVGWEDGRAVPINGAGKHEPLSLAELASEMAATGGPIVGTAALTAPMAGPGFGTHICDLEVDPDTGFTRVLRYTVVQDAGCAVHPAYVEGQLQGGAAQGIGWALNEEYIYDPQGRMENAGFLDYRMPVASDLPMIDTVIIEVPNPNHPYGVRGVGETPIVPPLGAVANALRAATGVRFTHLPISPPRIVEALEDRR
jgi:CO/xanthine dehydrogenase Mo-binding subunit